jgi:hypothetical protein
VAGRGGPRNRILDRYVLTGERVVVATRHHWAMLLEPVATTAAGLLVVVWLLVQAGPSAGDGLMVLWLLWLVLVARLAWKLLEWRNEWFVATDKRLLLLYGLITHKVAMMPLTKVTDLNYGRSLTGRVLGYGQFLLESAGQDQALRQIDWVARPEATYRRICDTLFGPGGMAGRPGGGAPAPVTVAPRSSASRTVDGGPVPPDHPSRTARPDGAEPTPVPPAPAWDGRSPVPPPPVQPAPPVPHAGDAVVVPGRSARPVTEIHGKSSGPTQPLPVVGPGDDHEDDPGWAVSGEHRATYVPVIHPRPTSPPVPKPYEPGPGRAEAP